MQGAHGHFELLAELGEGAFATVHRARDRRNGRQVALKLLKPEFRDNAEMVERFRREAHSASAISSPHVVQVFESGEVDGAPFIAMELIEGRPLRDFIDGAPFSVDEVHVIIGQVSAALAAAHRKQIVHRDLKPENIMLVGDVKELRVKVLDFGFAKMLDVEPGKEPLTKGGITFGTPAYMSPEQIQGQRADPLVDLYAAGVICYELLTGNLPWQATEPRELFLEILTTPPPPAAKLHASAKRPDRINHFLQRALAKTRNQRPRDAETFFGELEEALFGQAQQAAAKPAKAAFDSILGKTISIKPILLDSDEFGDAPPFESEVVEEPTPAPASKDERDAQAVAQATGGSGRYEPTTATLPRVPKPEPPATRTARRRVPLGLIVILALAFGIAAAVIGYYAGSR